MKTRCFYLIVSCFSYGDAICNSVIEMKKLLLQMGYVSKIYVESIRDKDAAINVVDGTIDNFPPLSESDIIIYQLCGSIGFLEKLEKFRCKKIIMYRNITPPSFYKEFDLKKELALKEGIREAGNFAGKFDYYLTVSEYNKQCLIAMGYPEQKISVLPVFIPFDIYENKKNYVDKRKYDDDYVNILFVGRIVPNKCIEDIIKVYAYYKKHIRYKSRLIFVGKSELPSYQEALDDYIAELSLSDVDFLGHVRTEELINIYNSASIFLCMSEHEGFCVPLVEAMYFQIPIIAYSSTAIPETLGNSGILVDKKDPCMIAGIIERIIIDKNLSSSIINAQNAQLIKFKPEHIKELYMKLFNKLIEI